MLEYVAKFTELYRFADDYVATDMTKVIKFEDGLKLSIRGKIMGFLLQHMDSMGHLRPNHQWDMHRHRLYLLTPAHARGTDYFTNKPGHRSRSGIGLTSLDFGDPRACLRHYTLD